MKRTTTIEKKHSFWIKIRDFEKALYWRIDIRNGNYNKLLLKEDRMVNAIQNNGPYSFTLDISDITQGAGTDVIYIPASVIEALKTDNTSLAIRTLGAEYTLRPDTVDTSSKEVVALRENPNVKGIYYKFTIKRLQRFIQEFAGRCRNCLSNKQCQSGGCGDELYLFTNQG